MICGMSTTTVIADAAWQFADTASSHATPKRSSSPVLIGPSAALVALRQATVMGFGGLTKSPTRHSGRLVAAYDVEGTAWWIPAEAIWADADTNPHPEHLRPTGLATASSASQAMVLGLSDRLGREAFNELERGTDLPILETPAEWKSVVAFDGRTIADVPTVVLVGDTFVRWGAGATWDVAFRRAMHGKAYQGDAGRELAQLQACLDAEGLLAVGVDVGSDLLRRAGINRLSVQLVTPHDGLGR
jgi:hypothetical protein